MRSEIRLFLLYHLLFALAIVAGAFVRAHARDNYVDDFNGFYETSGEHNYQSVLGSCLTSHPSGSNKNAYANDWKNNGRDFAAVEPIDSDGDGFSNIAEIDAGAFPGDPSSTPPVTIEDTGGGAVDGLYLILPS